MVLICLIAFLPTRSGRTGLAYTWAGKINLRNSKYKKDDTPLNKMII